MTTLATGGRSDCRRHRQAPIVLLLGGRLRWELGAGMESEGDSDSGASIRNSGCRPFLR